MLKKVKEKKNTVTKSHKKYLVINSYYKKNLNIKKKLKVYIMNNQKKNIKLR